MNDDQFLTCQMIKKTNDSENDWNDSSFWVPDYTSFKPVFFTYKW